MTTCHSRRVALRRFCLALTAVVAFGWQTQTNAQLDNGQGGMSPRMATYENAEGETCFSLSLGSVEAGDQRASDVIVLVDTSASQTGVYKQDSITVLQSFLSSLNASDRVKVFAVDLDPIALNQEFVSPDSAEALSSINNLTQRVALGSTDVIKMLKTVADGFQAADADNARNHNVVYIGDGVSRAGLVTDKALTKAMRKLVKNEVAFSSFAIGPDRNIELLAAIANHTGGNIFLDVDQPSSLDDAARGLANTVRGSVFWPTAAALPESISAIYPQVCPPIRSDRDSVVFGKITSRDPITLQLNGEINGKSESIVRKITPEESSIDFSFLPNLIDTADKNAGIRLPTVGSSGVRAYARVLDRTADSMANFGVRALAMNDPKAAVTFANAALERNPASNRGEQLAMAAAYRPQDNPFGDTPVEAAEDPFGATPSEPAKAPETADPFGAVVEAPEPDAAEDVFGSTAEETPMAETVEAPAVEEDGDIFGSDTNEAAGSDTKQMADSATTEMADSRYHRNG